MYSPDSHSSLDIYRRENIVRLEDSLKIHDTTLLEGASHTAAGQSSKQHGFKNYFSGYVFKGDIKPPDTIFESGFEVSFPKQSSDKMIRSLAGASTGRRMTAGVSTTICSQAAGWFTYHGAYSDVGYVYLINASEFKGIAVAHTPAPMLYGFHPHLAERICDVNFTHMIPNTSIVGVVWPKNYETPEKSDWRGAPALALYLAANPEYEKGMQGIKEVEKLFNQ